MWMWRNSLPPTKNIRLTPHLTSNIILANIVLGISVFGVGFSNNVYHSIQAMGAFARRFGTYDASKREWEVTATQLACFNSIPMFAAFAGLLAASHVGERRGRRAVLVLMQLVHVAGVALAYSATTFAQVLAGRMTYQAAVGMTVWLFPLVQAEIVPGAIRGVMLNLESLDMQLGYIVSAAVINHRTTTTSSAGGIGGSGNISDNDNRSWQVPLAMTLVFPCAVILASPLLPESPRWLLRRGRFEDAVESLRWLHTCRGDGDNGDGDGDGEEGDARAEEEARLLRKSLREADSTRKGAWGDLLRGVNKRRIRLVVLAAFFSQASGLVFASGYGAVFLKEIGGFNAFTGTLIRRAVMFMAPVTVMTLIERVPRRRFIITFATLATCSLLALGTLGCVDDPSPAVKRAIIAFTLFFSYARSCGFATASHLLIAEASPLALRDKTASVYWVTYNATEFFTSSSLPYLMRRLGARIGLLYGAASAVGVVWMIACVPDLRGRSLEEVEEMFAEGVPAWRSRAWQSSVDGIGAQITRLENEKVTRRNRTDGDGKDKIYTRVPMDDLES